MRELIEAEVKAELEAVMDSVVNDHAPVLVVRPQGEAVVLVSLADWDAMEKTAYLLSTPANARHIAASIAELDAGQGVERTLIEP